jgi:hypothetical protein
MSLWKLLADYLSNKFYSNRLRHSRVRIYTELHER